MIRVEALYTYPIKALKGISLDHAQIGIQGLPYDREWMLVDGNGLFVSQRKLPKLALFKQDIVNQGIRVQFMGDEIIVPFQNSPDSEQIDVEIWASKLRASLCSSEINNWFSSKMNTDIRLVHFGENSKRIREKSFANLSLKFADGYPILITSKSSLDALNEELESTIPMDRFRPNVVLSGMDAWQEFEIKEGHYQEHTIHFAKACERCTVTSIDQETGIKSPKEPLKTLVKLHGSPALFGMNAYVEREFKLKLGDELIF